MGLLDPDPNNTQGPRETKTGESPSDDPFDQLFKPREAAGTQTPGEFTKLFSTPPKAAPIAGLSEGSTPAAPSPQVGTERAVELPTSAPGAFTKMFMSPAGSGSKADRIDATLSIPQGPPTVRATPGEVGFADEQFVAPVQPPGPGPAPATAPVPGSFTELFGAPVSRPMDEVSAPTIPVSPGVGPKTGNPPEPSPPSVSAPNSAAGEFTFLFGSPLRQPASEKQTPPSVAAKVMLQPEPAPSGSADQEFAKAFNFPLRDSSRPAAESAGAQKQLGEFTKIFGRTSLASAPAPAPTPGSNDPDSFSKLFSTPRDSGGGAAPAREAGAFTKLFGPGGTPFKDPVAAPPTPSSGAFTKLFGKSASEPPQTSSAPATKEADVFRNLFGTAGAPAQSPQPRQSEPAPFAGKQPGTFTQIFGETQSRPGAGAAVFPKSPTEAPPSPQERQHMPDFFAPPSSQPLAPGKSEGATQIFSRPESPAPPSPEPTGPSAFTQIISGSTVRQAQQQAQQGPQTPSPQPAPGASFFQSQPMPGSPMPAVPPPTVTPPGVTPGSIGMGGVTPPAVSMPGMTPQTVQMPFMAPPQVQMPAAQFPPMQVPYPPPVAPHSAPAAKVNWVPLIIGANVLFVLIVILILIFALKK